MRAWRPRHFRLRGLGRRTSVRARVETASTTGVSGRASPNSAYLGVSSHPRTTSASLRLGLRSRADLEVFAHLQIGKDVGDLRRHVETERRDGAWPHIDEIARGAIRRVKHDCSLARPDEPVDRFQER